MSDTLGDRLLMFDNTGAPSLELLRFRPELADAPGFEAALREQVQRLASFQHPAFASVRSVERLEPDDDLALVSNHTPGKRLSEILHRAKGPALAAAVIKQLAPAIAHFQQQNPGVYRGLLSPDRIVVSPEARMTIVEHVVGAAIGTLNLPESELESLGVAPPAGTTGAAQIPEAAGDWYQLGIVALSGLIGRVVTNADLTRLDALVDEAFETAGSEAAPLSPFIRQWLGRALQAAEETQATEETQKKHRQATEETQKKHRQATEETQKKHWRATEETQKKHWRATEETQGEHWQATEETQGEHWQATEETQKKHGQIDAGSAPARSAPVEAAHHALVREVQPHRLFIPAQLDVVPRSSAAPVAAEENLSPFEREVLAGRMTLNLENRATIQDPVSVWGARVGAWRRRKISMSVVGAVVAIAAVEAGALAWMAHSRWSAARPAVDVQASPSGEHVLVAGESAGPTALAVAVAPDLGWVRVTSAPSVGVLGNERAETGLATVRISSPIELNVLEGARVIGSVPGRDLELTVGRHEIELVSEAFGYRVRQSIEVTAGQAIVVHVAPSPGWVAVEAAGAPEVTIDGQAVGRAPLGPLALAPGEHQVTFSHQGGRTERQRITVKTGATTKVVAAGR